MIRLVLPQPLPTGHEGGFDNQEEGLGSGGRREGEISLSPLRRLYDELDR